MYALLIILFTFFYTFVQINPEKAVKTCKSGTTFMVSRRPGKGTEIHVEDFFVAFTVGSIFLGVISILPIVAKDVFGLSEAVGN